MDGRLMRVDMTDGQPEVYICLVADKNGHLMVEAQFRTKTDSIVHKF